MGAILWRSNLNIILMDSRDRVEEEMDEYVKLEFELEPGQPDAGELERYFESQLLTRVPADKHVEQHGAKRVLTYDYTELDEAGLDDFFARATQTVKDTVVAVGNRETGAAALFANAGGGVELFESRAELETARGRPGCEVMVGFGGAERSDATHALEPARQAAGARSEAASTPEPEIAGELPAEAPFTLDFGGRGDANKLILRLHAASGERRKAIVEMFRSLEDFRTPKLLKAFEAQFAAHVSDSGQNRVKWPGYLGSDGQWHWGPENILDGFLSVNENGEFVYLVFDMANINRDQASMENFVATFLPGPFGTNGVWAKLTTVSGLKEKFFFEQQGEIRSTLRERSDDSEWRNPV